MSVGDQILHKLPKSQNQSSLTNDLVSQCYSTLIIIITFFLCEIQLGWPIVHKDLSIPAPLTTED